MSRALLIAATLAVSCAAAAAENKPAERRDDNACVFFRSIDDFRALDRDHLIIWAPSRRDAYLVELGMPLPDLTFSTRLALVDSNGDGRLCGFGMDRVIVGSAIFPQRSTIMGMTRLDEAALLELEQQYKVKLLRKKREQPPQAAQ
jgi:hypothetical protein